MGNTGLGVRAAPPLPRPSPRSPARTESQSSKAQPERSKKELFVSDLRTRGFKVAQGRLGYSPPTRAEAWELRRVGKMGGGCRGSLFVLPPLTDSAPLSAGRLFPPPLSSPPSCSSLRGQGSPPPPIAGRGAAGLTPPPTRTFPLPLPRRPRACTGWTLRPGARGGGGLAAPCPSAPSESGPGRGRGRGKGAGRRCSNLFPSPGGGRGSGSYVRVCAPTGPPTPPPCSAGGGGS